MTCIRREKHPRPARTFFLQFLFFLDCCYLFIGGLYPKLDCCAPPRVIFGVEIRIYKWRNDHAQLYIYFVLHCMAYGDNIFLSAGVPLMGCDYLGTSV